jgi:hypothetical protein
MSTRYPIEPSQNDYHQDHEWQREQQARQSLTISDVLSTIDDLIAQEAREEQHPLHGVVAYLLGRSPTPGTNLYDHGTCLAG